MAGNSQALSARQRKLISTTICRYFFFVLQLNNFSTDALGDLNDVFAWNHGSLVGKYVPMKRS